jgi:RNA polymerase sigma factor (sigma-70 family)
MPGEPRSEPGSFEEFFEAQRSPLFGTLTLVTGNRFEAEEIMQDAFLRIWERWDRVSVMAEPAGYLYLTAMNVFRSRYRRAALALRRAAAVAPTEDALATVDDRDVVVRALRELSPGQRAAIVLTAYAGFTSEEAGRALGMRAGTVRTLATRARAAMRERAEEFR